MGFAIAFESTEPVEPARAEALRQAAEKLTDGRTWLSCEPPSYFHTSDDGRLSCSCKPNFMPHPDDVASAQASGLPDGTVEDVVEVLCTLSRDFGVDWEFSHDYSEGVIAQISNGVADEELLEQIRAFAQVNDLLEETGLGFDGDELGFGMPGMDDGEFDFGEGPDDDDPDDDDEPPQIFKFPS